MDILTWYANKVKLPKFGTNESKSFIQNASGLLSGILKRDGISIKVVVTDSCYVPTACADLENQIIYIGSEFYTLSKTSDTKAYGAYLGVVCHEAAHFWKKSPKPVEIGSLIVDSLGTGNKDFAANLYNILEDIYIERAFSEKFENLSWMLEDLAAFLFPDGLEDDVRVVEGMKSQPKTKEELSSCCNFLFRMKIDKDYAPNSYAAKTLKFFTEMYVSDIEKRVENTKALYVWLTDGIPENESLEDFESLSESINTKGASVDFDELSEGEKSLLEYDGKDQDRLIDTLDIVGHENRGIDIVYRKMKLTDPKVSVSSDFGELSKVARLNATQNRPYHRPKDSGTKIRRTKVSRIVSDGKVFSSKKRLTRKDPPEVIILIDCSQSMQSVALSGKTYIREAVDAALGSVVALRKGRSIVKVFGHTTLGRNFKNEIVIFELGKESDSIQTINKKLSNFYLSFGEHLMVRNGDGYAIESISEKFVTKYGKVLVVISDGAPSEYDLKFFNGVQHTEHVVNEVRKKGINVVSLSIGFSSYTPNDCIYGPEFNAKAENPNDLVKIIEKLV